MFKTVIISGLALMAASMPAVADTVLVTASGAQRRLQSIDLERMTVCDLKARVASEMGLNIKKFDLHVGYRPADGNANLAAAGVRSGGQVQVKEVSSSRQC